MFLALRFPHANMGIDAEVYALPTCSTDVKVTFRDGPGGERGSTSAPCRPR